MGYAAVEEHIPYKNDNVADLFILHHMTAVMDTFLGILHSPNPLKKRNGMNKNRFCGDAHNACNLILKITDRIQCTQSKISMYISLRRKSAGKVETNRSHSE